MAVEQPLPQQFTQEHNTATGEYGYSYSGGSSSKTEFRANDGTTTGAYSYVDPHGILQTVNYIADEFGFRAAGSTIPSENSLALDGAKEISHPIVEHQLNRRKRGVYLAAAPVAVAPVSTSSQSRVQVHRNAQLITHQPIVVAHPAIALLNRKKRGLVAAPLYVEHLPFSSSHQERYQIHNSAKIIQEYHQPIVEAKAALPVAPIIYEQLPLSSSHQERYQIHNNAKIVHEYHQPIYASAPVVNAPTYLQDLSHPATAPIKDYYPAAPAESTLVSDDAVAVESA